jgi:hypothetical protein
MLNSTMLSLSNCRNGLENLLGLNAQSRVKVPFDAIKGPRSDQSHPRQQHQRSARHGRAHAWAAAWPAFTPAVATIQVDMPGRAVSVRPGGATCATPRQTGAFRTWTSTCTTRDHCMRAARPCDRIRPDALRT